MFNDTDRDQATHMAIRLLCIRGRMGGEVKRQLADAETSFGLESDEYLGTIFALYARHVMFPVKALGS